MWVDEVMYTKQVNLPGMILHFAVVARLPDTVSVQTQMSMHTYLYIVSVCLSVCSVMHVL